jgi:hypothetical protein
MPRPNRRLGDREQVEPTQIQWNVPAPGWRQWFKRRQPQAGLLRDVSVTGAGVLAPVDPSITRGSVVAVAFGWIEGNVVVRRIDPQPDGSNAVYGVEFENTHSPLAQAIHEVFLDRDVPPY